MTDAFDLSQYPGYVDRLFHIESGGDPNSVTGSNRGLGQFGPSEESRYGITDANRGTYAAQAAAVGQEAAEHAKALQKSLGRPPTAGELYLTHQQGVAGGPALLSANTAQPAWMAIRPYYKSDAIAQKAISGNIPSDHALYRTDVNQITAGDFRNLWVNKFEGGGSGAAIASRGASPGSSFDQRSGGGAGAAVPPGAVAAASGGGSGVAPDASTLAAMTQDQTGALGQAQKFLGTEETPLQPAPPMQLPVNQARLRNVLAGKMGANPNGMQLPPSVKERIAALMGKMQG